jgi:hypothetical protein
MVNPKQIQMTEMQNPKQGRAWGDSYSKMSNGLIVWNICSLYFGFV